jgi:8-oxo-dGTP pyrophosphatase MutT (NUDIX family)
MTHAGSQALHAQFVGAILISEGRILLGLRSHHRCSCPNCWDVIGGHVEPGETTVEALARELEEEIGITDPLMAPLRSLDGLDPTEGRFNLQLFLVSDWRGAPAPLGDEHAEIRWFHPDEAAALTNLSMPEYASIFARL